MLTWGLDDFGMSSRQVKSANQCFLDCEIQTSKNRVWKQYGFMRSTFPDKGEKLNMKSGCAHAEDLQIQKNSSKPEKTEVGPMKENGGREEVLWLQ